MNYFLIPLKKYADFKGRARRKEYWQFVLFVTGIYIISMVAGQALGLGQTLYSICALALMIPNLAVGVRRMHDVNKSGWFLIIPIYNLILACTDGTAGTNQYGPDPKRPEFEDFLSDKTEPVQPA